MVFEDFLRSEYSEENLLFWLACEDYKRSPSQHKMAAAAQRIFAEFVQVDAPRQASHGLKGNGCSAEQCS